MGVHVRSPKKYLKFHKNIWGPGDLPGARRVPKKNTKTSTKIIGALGTSQVHVRSRKKNTKNSTKIFGALGTSQVPVGSRKKILKIPQKMFGALGTSQVPVRS